jgi:hypothetical protein
VSEPHAYLTCRGSKEPGTHDPEKACGSVPLTEQEFDRQLFNFGKPWFCPRCGSRADFDREKTDAAELATFMESLNV